MNKTILAIIAVVVVGGGAWLFMSKSADSPTMEDTEMNEPAQTTEETATDDTETSDRGSLAEVFALGDNVRCEYKSTVEGEVSEGTFYTDGERFRVESTYTDTQKTFTSNMINDGEFMYTWSDSPSGTMAIKMPAEETKAPDTQASTPGDGGNNTRVNMEQEVEYDCDRWNVDTSQFVPPSDIEFTDMGAMMQDIQQGLPEGFEMPQ